MSQNKTKREEIITLANIAPEIRNSSELMIKTITTLLSLYGNLILDCGCIITSPDFAITVVEMMNGVRLAVCKNCEVAVWKDANYIGSIPTKISY